jgi:hypothetical protein
MSELAARCRRRLYIGKQPELGGSSIAASTAASARDGKRHPGLTIVSEHPVLAGESSSHDAISS